MKKILRWMAILPAVVATFVVVFGVLNLWLTYSRPADGEPGEGSLINLVASLIAGLVASYASMEAAVHIAPNNKNHVVFGVTVLLLLLVGYGLYQIINIGYSWRRLQEVIGITIGTIASNIQINKELKEQTE